MTDLQLLLSRLAALEARVAALEAERHQPIRMTYNWGREDAPHTTYEYYVDPAMRMTRNGN